MPDLWDSGPALPPPGGPEHGGTDRSSSDARGRSADAAVQHIDDGAYRTGDLPVGTTPFPFEQAERGLDTKLAGVYGESAVPAVRQALRDAVAAEGNGAYDRLGSDPGAFGEVRGGTAGVELLGRELREVEAYRAQCVEQGYLVPVDPPDVQRAPAESGASPSQQIDRDPGWLTERDAEIAVKTREALVERRSDLVREIERHGGGRREEAQQKLALVDRSVEALDRIGARQDLAFTFRNAQSGDDRGTTGVRGDRSDDGRPVVEIVIAGARGSDVAANRVHELYHAGEFARGRVFVREGTDRRLEGAAVDFYSGDEEVAAYRTQFAFDDSSLVRSSYGNRFTDRSFDRAPRNLGEVNRAYVEGLKNQDGSLFYQNLQWAP